MAYDPNLGYDPTNIAKYINEAAARQDDAEVERLSIERWNKVQGDPNLMSQYGNDVYSQVARSALKRQPQDAPVQDLSPESAAQPAVQSFPDMMQWIDQLSAQQRAGAVAGVEQARTSALSSLEGERAKIQPFYTEQRTQTAARGALDQQAMSEAMAQRGLGASGAAGELQSRSVGQVQSGLGALQRGEAEALQDVLRRQTEVEQNYQAALQQATSAAEAQRLQMLIEQVRSDRQYTLQEAQLTGMLGGQTTMQGQQAAREAAQFDINQEDRAINMQDRAMQREIETISQFANQPGGYMAEIQRRQATPDTADDALIPYLTIARDMKIAAEEAQKSSQATAQYGQALDMFKQLGVANGWIAQALGLPEGAKSMDYQEMLYTVNKPYFAPSSGGTSTSTQFNQLMSVWKATGVAPAGLEGWGVQPGTPLAGNEKKIQEMSVSEVDKDIKGILERGYNKETLEYGAGTVETAIRRIQQMVETGVLSEADADLIIRGNRALANAVMTQDYGTRGSLGR